MTNYFLSLKLVIIQKNSCNTTLQNTNISMNSLTHMITRLMLHYVNIHSRRNQKHGLKSWL